MPCEPRGGRGDRGRGRGGQPDGNEMNDRINELAATVAAIQAAMGIPNPHGRGGNVPAPAAGNAPAQGQPVSAAGGVGKMAEEALREEYLQYHDRFHRMRPTRFDGAPDPDRAELWLMMMEKYFKGLRCPEPYRVSLAAFTLEGEAEHWYQALERMANEEGRVIDWPYFTTEFRAQYMGRGVRMAKMDEFYALEQGNMTVAQYEAKFSNLIRYVPEYERSAELKAEKFRTGLKAGIRGFTVGVYGYRDIVLRAQEGEREWMLVETAREASKSRTKKSNYQTQSSGSSGSKKRKSWSGSNSGSSDKCNDCGRLHGNTPCYRSVGACFECGEPGHKKATCPRLASRGQNQIRSFESVRMSNAPAATQGTQGWDLAMNRRGARESTGGASGILSIN